jgi:hypothetical protein
MRAPVEIQINGDSPLFDRTNMHFREFASDYRRIRYYTMLIIRSAPTKIREFNLLEQQVSEIIKNGIRHGNKNDPEKKIRVWYLFNQHIARLIVEDEGEGFRDLERWNEFNRRRLECIKNQRFDELVRYISFRTESHKEDGGNALFASLEYWNAGFIFNEKRNAVAMKKIFPRKTIYVQQPLADFIPWEISDPV